MQRRLRSEGSDGMHCLEAMRPQTGPAVMRPLPRVMLVKCFGRRAGLTCPDKIRSPCGAPGTKQRHMVADAASRCYKAGLSARDRAFSVPARVLRARSAVPFGYLT
jgi:hypothetical protein